MNINKILAIISTFLTKHRLPTQKHLAHSLIVIKTLKSHTNLTYTTYQSYTSHIILLFTLPHHKCFYNEIHQFKILVKIPAYLNEIEIFLFLKYSERYSMHVNYKNPIRMSFRESIFIFLLRLRRSPIKFSSTAVCT